jgi:putative FmdB family regulatory protein
MPLYTYKCKCGKTEDAWRSIAEMEDSPECHGKMIQVIIPPNIAPILGGGNNPGYHCVVTDQWVDSKRKRREIMKEHNLVEAG